MEIGAIVKRRRADLRLSQRRAAIRADLSPTTWANLESGLAVNDISATAIARALQWPADAIRQLRDGVDVDAIPAVDEPSQRSVEDRLDEFEQRFSRIEHLLDQLEERLAGLGGSDGHTASRS